MIRHSFIRRTLVLASILGGLAGADPKVSLHWPQFRGPGGSGSALESSLPPTTGLADRVAWKTPLPPGHSSPVIVGDRLFLTAVEGGRLHTLCLDRKEEKLLWRRQAPEVPLEKVHATGSPAGPSPLADAERVMVYFGSYGLIAYDHDGMEIWKHPIPTGKSLYGFATSPIAFKDSVILVLDDDRNLPASKLSQSRILCLEKSTGVVRWESPRPQHRSGWSTPTIWNHAGGAELVVLGSSRAAGYNPATGEELWFAGGFSRETIALPVADARHIYISSAQLGGGADAQIDPAPFWEALLPFDKDGDGRIAREEMTGDFTYPLRPELPLGHPGFGIPQPQDPAAREKRIDGILKWVDRDHDDHWSREEFEAHLAGKQARPRLLAIRPGGRGNVDPDHVAWELNKSIPEIPSPLVVDDILYLVRNGGILAAIDTRTGKQVYRERTGGSGQYNASPVAATNHLFLVSNRGEVSVIKSGDQFVLVSRFDLGEPVHATPAIAGRTLYIRTESHLWAFRDSRE